MLKKTISESGRYDAPNSRIKGEKPRQPNATASAAGRLAPASLPIAAATSPIPTIAASAITRPAR